VSDRDPDTLPASDPASEPGSLAPPLGQGPSQRFELVREIGAGGMGTVYEAIDRESGHRVALKTLRRVGSDATFRLKREFRSLADLEHENLVRLYELVVDGAEVYFSMELVEGVDVLTYVREGVEAAPGDASPTGATENPTGQRPLACDEARLRRVLPQLASGLAAIHRAGKLHRDIKPSNVLVTREGRVKILDFGLMVDIDQLGMQSLDGAVGTPTYMSPEQAFADPNLGPASDWYSFGTILYEALTGQLPFSGLPMQVLLKKTREVPPPPRQLVPDVPADLDWLAEGLLAREPAERVREHVVLEKVGVVMSGRMPAVATSGSGNYRAPFRGREVELESLREQLAVVRDTRQSRLVVVSGDSGIGKSSFIAELLSLLEQDHRGLVVLHGRCYESESVPHKALDPVIDELSRHWLRLDAVPAARLLPRDAHLLPLLFPVLGRVSAIARQRSHFTPSDPQDRRLAAHAALRETFARLSLESPLVVVIDDMQWTDSDSPRLLADLIRPPDGAAALVILGSRPSGLEPGMPLAEMLEETTNAPVHIVALEPLSADECGSIARDSLGDDVTDDLVEGVVAEAGGNPFFVKELARHLAEHGAVSLGDRPPGVDDLIAARASSLPVASRTLLEVVAVAAEPLSAELAATVAGLPTADLTNAVRQLRTVSLLRTGGTGIKQLECYHDRVRAAVMASLPADRAAEHHRVLANALRARDDAAPERIADHYRACGEGDLAADFFQRAAARSVEALDFGRAASHYAGALELGTFGERERADLLVRLGDSLAQAGRHAAAADCFEQALAQARDEAQAIDLQRRIAEARLSAGDIDAGLDAARSVARAAGFSFPRRRLPTLVTLAANEMRLRWRDRSAGRATVAAREGGDDGLAVRVDVCRSLERSLIWVDVSRGAMFAQRTALLAPRTGSEEGEIEGLTGRAAWYSVIGERKKADRRVAVLRQIARERDSPLARAGVGFVEAITALFHDLDPERSLQHNLDARTAAREAGLGTGNISDQLQVWRLQAFLQGGRFRELSTAVVEMLSACARDGNRFLEVMARTLFAFRHLAAANPAGALQDVAHGLSMWPDENHAYTTLHWAAAQTRALALRYMGQFDRELEVWRKARAMAKRAGLYNLNNLRIGTTFHHAMASLATDDGRSVAHGRRVARGLAREKKQRNLAMLGRDLLLANVAHRAGDEDAALTHLRAVADAPYGRRAEVLSARYRLGLSLEGTEGQTLADTASVALRRLGVADVECFASLYTPAWKRD